MASTFSVDGIISGLKTKDIIDSLMAIERQPMNTAQAQLDKETARSKALATVRTQFASFQSAVARLADRTQINVKSAVTDTPASSPVVLTATAGVGAANGSFAVTVSRIATATRATSAGPLGQVIDASAKLASAGFRMAPVTSVNGNPATFSINGVAISVDDNTTLNDGSANSIIAKINAAGAGVTASLVADADGRANNRVQLVSNTADPIQLGSFADTSNVLKVLNLADAAPSTTMVSTMNLGVVDTTKPLTSARLATPIAGLDVSGNGKISVNGVEITYRATDSLSDIANRINSSGAGVTVAYDSIQDRLRVTAQQTGAQIMGLQDVTGNLLAATGLLGATQSVGQQALFSIEGVNNGQPITSNSNTVSGYIPGVTLALRSASATPVTVTIGQNTDSTSAQVHAFVDSFNKTLDSIDALTAVDPKQPGLLSGDPGLTGIQRSLRSIVSDMATGATGAYRSFADIGVSTGAIGSAIGSTSRLKIDDAKLAAALKDNPQAVESLLAGFSAATGAPTGTGNVTGVSGSPLSQHEDGTYHVKVLDAVTGDVEVSFVALDGRQLMKKTAVLAPNSQNTTLIPGLTLTTGPTLSVGEDTFALTVTGRGVMVQMKDRVDNLLAAGNYFDTRKDSGEAIAKALADRIDSMQTRLTDKEATLNRKFAALESAMAQLQAQGNALASQLANLGRQQN